MKLEPIEWDSLLSDDAKAFQLQPYKPSAIAHKPPRSAARAGERPDEVEEIVKPTKIELDGVTWFAVRTAHGCERSVTKELNGVGYRAYCPLGARRVWYKRSGRKIMRQRPVFTRYIFVGCFPGRPLGKQSAEDIEAILKDSHGPLRIAPIVIELINELELAGQWNEKAWPASNTEKAAQRDVRETVLQKLNLEPGEQIRITGGPFETFWATFEANTAENQIRVLIEIFGRLTPVTVDPCQVEKV